MFEQAVRVNVVDRCMLTCACGAFGIAVETHDHRALRRKTLPDTAANIAVSSRSSAERARLAHLKSKCRDVFPSISASRKGLRLLSSRHNGPRDPSSLGVPGAGCRCGWLRVSGQPIPRRGHSARLVLAGREKRSPHRVPAGSYSGQIPINSARKRSVRAASDGHLSLFLNMKTRFLNPKLP